MRKRWISTLVATAIAAGFVTSNAVLLTKSPFEAPGVVGDELARTFETVAGGGSVVDAKANREGKHLGFDTYAYPGDDVMLAWRHESVPYEWVGYYLPAPCHDGTTWMGKRARLAEMGWGMAVIYVGQQTWDKTPTGFETQYRDALRTQSIPTRVKVYRTVKGKRVARYVTRRVAVKRTVRVPVRVRVDAKARPIEDCNAQLVSATRGTLEAKDAIARTQAEGFAPGSVIFLDVEYMRSVPQKMRDYYRAWAAEVLRDGRYRPGMYAHTRNAETIFSDVKAVYAKAGRTDEPPFWIAGGSAFSTDKEPRDVGHTFAAMWQGVINVVEDWNGYSVPIDVNVAEVRDPSHASAPVDKTRVADTSSSAPVAPSVLPAR
jgi:hypothetical protein